MSQYGAAYQALPEATEAEIRAALAETLAEVGDGPFPLGGMLLLTHSRLRRAGLRTTCPVIALLWRAS